MSGEGGLEIPLMGADGFQVAAEGEFGVALDDDEHGPADVELAAARRHAGRSEWWHAAVGAGVVLGIVVVDITDAPDLIEPIGGAEALGVLSDELDLIFLQLAEDVIGMAGEDELGSFLVVLWRVEEIHEAGNHVRMETLLEFIDEGDAAGFEDRQYVAQGGSLAKWFAIGDSFPYPAGMPFVRAASLWPTVVKTSAKAE